MGGDKGKGKSKDKSKGKGKFAILTSKLVPSPAQCQQLREAAWYEAVLGAKALIGAGDHHSWMRAAGFALCFRQLPGKPVECSTSFAALQCAAPEAIEIPEPLNLWEAFSAGRNRCSSVTKSGRQTSVRDAEACVGAVAIHAGEACPAETLHRPTSRSWELVHP